MEGREPETQNAYALLTDERLIELLRTGDDEAERVLYERYKPIVRSRTRAYFLIGADHEDLVQEGMFGLFRAVQDYDSSRGAAFRSFAEVCVTRQILTAIKLATRKKHSPLNSYVSLSGPAYDGEDERQLVDVIEALSSVDPEETLLSRELLDALSSRIREALSPYERRVLELYLQGDSYRQIANTLGKTEKSVDNALKRVKKKLQLPLLASE